MAGGTPQKGALKVGQGAEVGRADSEEVWREIPGCRVSKGGLSEKDPGRLGTSPGKTCFRARFAVEGDREPTQVLERAGHGWCAQKKRDLARESHTSDPALPPDTAGACSQTVSLRGTSCFLGHCGAALNGPLK